MAQYKDAVEKLKDPELRKKFENEQREQYEKNELEKRRELQRETVQPEQTHD